MSWKILYETNKKKSFLVNCWPSGKYVNLLYMHSILGRGSFCFNYCLNSAWHGGDQVVALQATWAMSFSTLPPDSSTLVSKWNTKLALIWKEDFGPQGNSPVLLLLSPGKTPLTTTVAKFLDTSVCGALDALTPASVHSLWSSPKLLNRFSLTILIRLRFSRLIVHLFLPHFFLPLNFLLTCLDTAPCEQPASLAMDVCGLPSLWRVSMIVFWTTVRSVFPMIV